MFKLKYKKKLTQAERHKYEAVSVLLKIRKILCFHDIAKFIEQGGPDDEYDLQVPRLITLLYSDNDKDKISNDIRKTYEYLFGGTSTSESGEEVYHDPYEIINRERLERMIADLIAFKDLLNIKDNPHLAKGQEENLKEMSSKINKGEFKRNKKFRLVDKEIKTKIANTKNRDDFSDTLKRVLLSPLPSKRIGYLISHITIISILFIVNHILSFFIFILEILGNVIEKFFSTGKRD